MARYLFRTDIFHCHDWQAGLVPAYLKLKRQEWDAYARHLSPWERTHTLDC